MPENFKFIEILVAVVSEDILVRSASITIVSYSLIILLIFLMGWIPDFRFLSRLSKKINSSTDTNETFLLFLNLVKNNKFREEHIDRENPSETSVRDEVKGVSARASGTSTRSQNAFEVFLRTFLSLESNRHYAEGIRPAFHFLNVCDPGPKVNVISAYNTLVRLSLVVTFFGIAYILFLSGQDIGAVLEKAKETGVIDVDEMTQSVLGIVTASATKFWITAIGYFAGNLLLIISQIFEGLRERKIRKITDFFESSLDSDEAESLVRKKDDEFSTKEKSRLQKVLADNIENISAMGKEVNDNLIGKLSNIALDTKVVCDLIIRNVNDEFKELRRQGITVPVHNLISQDVRILTELLVEQVSINTKNVEELKRLVANTEAGTVKSKLKPVVRSRKTPRRTDK